MSKLDCSIRRYRARFCKGGADSKLTDPLHQANGIQPIATDHYEVVRQFLIEVGWEHRVGSAEQFARLMENTDRTVVAWDGSRVIGFARALCDEVSNGYVSTVAVAADYRRRGIGRRLVESLIGDDPNITWVLRAGRGSESFWEKMGFKKSEGAMERVRVTK